MAPNWPIQITNADLIKVSLKLEFEQKAKGQELISTIFRNPPSASHDFRQADQHQQHQDLLGGGINASGA